MLIPLQCNPIHRNRRSKPFEGCNYATPSAAGIRASQFDSEEGYDDDDEDYGEGFGGEE
ncbi:MAG: hypothetical protein OEX82_08550 [Nitrosomonas sp.]|nr:hypothetical protein [Nitrosomonas sp.]